LPNLAIASSRASTQKLASSVSESRHPSHACKHALSRCLTGHCKCPRRGNGQHLAGCPIHDRHQMKEASFHRDVGEIATPHLIGPDEGKVSQQVGINAVLRMLLAGVRPLVNSLYAYNAHQAAHTVPPCREPCLGKIGRNLAAPKERLLREYLINLMHKIKRFQIKNQRVCSRWMNG
jgi:hypothetical protein